MNDIKNSDDSELFPSFKWRDDSDIWSTLRTMIMFNYSNHPRFFNGNDTKWKGVEGNGRNDWKWKEMKRKWQETKGNVRKLNDIARKYILISLVSSHCVSFHFFSFHLMSIQVHSNFYVNTLMKWHQKNSLLNLLLNSNILRIVNLCLLNTWNEIKK